MKERSRRCSFVVNVSSDTVSSDGVASATFRQLRAEHSAILRSRKDSHAPYTCVTLHGLQLDYSGPTVGVLTHGKP